MKYKRVLLKISGEALMGDKEFGHSYEIIKQIADDILEVQKMGIQVCVVVGGGNIYRGSMSKDLFLDRVSADHVGMLATVMNGLIMKNIFESLSITTRVLSPIHMIDICEPYSRDKALRYMEKNICIIFAGGTGNPLCTTDSAAVLRAIEMNCDLLLKATKVNGVYDLDPVSNSNAIKYNKITYKEILQNNLSVMDMSSVASAMEHKLPIIVFSIKEKGNFAKIINNQGEYTKIEE
jgi:uridylate kinase